MLLRLTTLFIAFSSGFAMGQHPISPTPPHQHPLCLGDTKITQDIIEPKLNGNELASLYRKYTGRRVIISASAEKMEFSFVQEASPQKPLTYAKAAECIKQSALIENYIFTHHPQNPEIDVLSAKHLPIHRDCIAVTVYNEKDTLPTNEKEVISYVMKLEHLKPDDAVKRLSKTGGGESPYFSISVVPQSNALVITDTTSTVRKLITLKNEIDKP